MDVKSHSFFEGMDWTMAAERLLTPPFIPKLKSPVDTKMFSPFYLNQEVLNESFNSTNNSSLRNHFADFDFNRSKDSVARQSSSSSTRSDPTRQSS